MLYITGDTHGDWREFEQRMHPYKLTADDILIVTGDFGFSMDKWTAINWIKMDRSYTTLFCDGNHENFDVLDSLPLVSRYGDLVSRFDENTFRLLTGHMYTLEGIKTFVFGGASSIDKDWRVDPDIVKVHGKLWWQQEVPTKESVDCARRVLEENGWCFDLFISHTTRPDFRRRILEDMSVESFYDPVEDLILSLEQEIEFHGGSWQASYFGHLHRDVDIGRRHCLYHRVLKV